jgi:hypothetical protein
MERAGAEKVPYRLLLSTGFGVAEAGPNRFQVVNAQAKWHAIPAKLCYFSRRNSEALDGPEIRRNGGRAY